MQEFEGGHIYSSDNTGARPVTGRTLRVYLDVEGPGGPLGLPIVDVDGATVFQMFEGGHVRVEGDVAHVMIRLSH